MNKVCVIGLGHVGLATACLITENAKIQLTLVDSNPKAFDNLDLILSNQANAEWRPYRDLARSSLVARNISVTEDVVAMNDVFVVCISTPVSEFGQVDLSGLQEIVDRIARTANSDKLIVIRTTVPVGTTKMLNSAARRVSREHRVDVVFNPEFLRQATALNDTLFGTILLGLDSDQKEVAERFFSYVTSNDIRTASSDEAEAAKLALNSYLATRLSFINEVSQIFTSLGVDSQNVLDIMARDKRFGDEYRRPGPGWGGGCLGKDLSILMNHADELGLHYGVLDSVEYQNEQQARKIQDMVLESVADLAGKNILVVGVSFDCMNYDPRKSTGMDLARWCVSRGANVYLHDEAATLENVKKFDDSSKFQIHNESVDYDLVVLFHNRRAIKYRTDRTINLIHFLGKESIKK